MGKAKIISGGTDGRYTIQILTLKTKAEARIDALEEEIEKLRSGEEVEFSPSLYDQYVTLLDLIDQYRDAIEDNRNKENDQKELINKIALEQQRLETLEDDLSYLESIRDTRLEEYEEAEYSYEHEEITEDEYLFYQSRYLTAQANVVAKLASVAVRQAVVAALEAEKSAIKFAELDKDLDAIEKKAETFFEFDAKETLDQLDSHIDYGETLVSHMAQAFNASIEWYNDAEQQNYEDAIDKAEWTEEQYPVSVQMNDAHTEMSAAKTARDSAQEEYDEQYVSYIRGDIGEEDLEPYATALSLAQADYSAKLAQYNIYYDQWEALEVQINGCVKIDTKTMQTRLNDTNTAYTVMSQDLAALTAFRDRQELKITSMEKELERLQDAVDVAERTIDAWCADLTEDLEADTEVGTIEISGEPTTILVHPGYDGAATYDQERDGQLQPPAISTAAQAFYNFAMLPGWQRWKPTFRLGTIRSLDGDLATVDLDAAASVAQGLDINGGLETIADVPIDYMSCNGAAFEEGDRVVVKFTDGDWDQPTVIGFEEEPQACLNVIVIRYQDGTKAYYNVNLSTGATAAVDNAGIVDLETLGVEPNKDSRFYCGVDKDGNQYFLCGKPFYWLVTGYKEWYSEDYGYNFSYNFDVSIDKQLMCRCFDEMRAPTDPEIYSFVGDSFYTLEFYALKLSNQLSVSYYPSMYANQSQDMQLRTTQVDSVYFADEYVEVIEAEYSYANRNDPYDDETNGPETWFPALVHAPYYRRYGYDGSLQTAIDLLLVMETTIVGFSSNDPPYYQIGSIRRTSETVYELTIYKNDEWGSDPYVTTYVYQWTIGAATATLSETIPNADTSVTPYSNADGRDGYFLWPVHSKLSVEGYQGSYALNYEELAGAHWVGLSHSRAAAKLVIDGTEYDPDGFTTKCGGVQAMDPPGESVEQGCAVWLTNPTGLNPYVYDTEQWPHNRNLFPMFHDIDNNVLVYATGVCDYWQNNYGSEDPPEWESTWLRFKNQYWLKIADQVFQLGFLPGQETNDDPIQAYFIQRHNEIRAAAGKGSLKYYVKIYDAAQGHSDDMALNNFFDHIGSDSHDVFWRLTQQDFDFTDYGENIHMRGSLDYTGDAATDLTEAEIDSIMQDFIDSPEHYANLLDEDFDLCGIGYAYSSEDQKWYITVNFTNEQLEMVESEYNYFRYHNDDPELDTWDYWCSGTAITDMSFSVVDNHLLISYLVARVEKEQVDYTPGAASWTTHEKVETPDKRIFAIYDIAAKELLWRGEIDGVTLDTRLTAGFIPASIGEE